MKTSTVTRHRKRKLSRVLLGFSIIFSIILMSAVDYASSQVRRVVFEGARSEHKWALKDLNPELPSDWSSFGYLVLETGVDEPVISTTENYNIGILDVTDRPYPEMVKALITAHKRLLAVHSCKAAPFSRRPRASEAGTPSYRLSDAF